MSRYVRVKRNLEIRKITPELAVLLKEVRLAALKEAPGAFGSTYREEAALSDTEWETGAAKMSREGAIGLLVISEMQPCGLVRGYLEPDDALCARLASLWVAPECRRAGVAGDLLAQVEQWAIGMGARELRLTVTENNTAAIAFYKRHGFEATGRTEPYPNDPNLLEREMCKRL